MTQRPEADPPTTSAAPSIDAPQPAWLRVPDDATLDAEQRELLERFPTARGARLDLFRCLTDAPRIMRRVLAGGMLDDCSPLTLRQRELVIWRVCARCGCEYEWGVHVAGFARAAALGPEQVRASLLDPATIAAGALDAEAALLFAVVDALHDFGNLDEALRAAFATRFDRPQQLEILALAGFYHSISYIANVARLSCEPFGPGFATA